jgi:hypothetical protein
MEILDILYSALATILVMIVLQVSTFFVTKMLYPPEPRIIYRDVPSQPRVQFVPQPEVFQAPPPAVLTQAPPNIQLPEYEPRKQASDSIRLDPELPAGIQETRPAGT